MLLKDCVTVQLSKCVLFNKITFHFEQMDKDFFYVEQKKNFN